MIMDAEYQCAYCGEINATTVDPSAGLRQIYIEDCQVCCNPNLLQIEIDPDSQTASIKARQEN